MITDKTENKLPKGIRFRGYGYEGRVTHNGKTYYTHGKTLAEVANNLSSLRYNLCHDSFVESSNLSFDEWFHVWIQEYKKHRIKIGTFESYKSFYQSLIQPHLGDIPLSKITCSKIQMLYNELFDLGYSLSTIKIVSVIIGGCLQQAVNNGMLERNYARLALLPKKTEHQTRNALTREQQTAFVLGAQNSYLKNFFLILLRTGLRNGELRGLKYSDIDLKNKVLHIRRTLKYIDGRGYFEDTPKTLSSVRDIPLTDDIIEMLLSQKSYWGFSAERPNRYLFCTKTGAPLSRDRVQKELDRIIKNINESGFPFEHITPHVFRHTFATRAIEAGMSPQVLKTILGHSSLAMTMDLYSHVMPEIRATEMEKIASAF